MTALDRKETSDQEVSHKLQEVKDAAKAQAPIGVSPPEKASSAGSDSNDADVATSAVVEGSSKASTDAKADGEKSVAGRKTMKGGETKDVHSGKEAPKDLPKAADKQKVEDADEVSSKADKVESKEDHEIETELNSILKKGPSRFLQLYLLRGKCRSVTQTNFMPLCSNNIQQILLPSLCQS